MLFLITSIIFLFIFTKVSKDILMKKLWDVIDLIDLKFSTLIFLITSFLLGNFKDIALYFFIALIHELMHFFACVHFKLAVKKLVVLPFGACLQVDKMEKVSSIKQIIIYMSLKLLIQIILIQFLIHRLF